MFEEDYALVKGGISIGNDVTSELSSIEGYVDGNVYINSVTLDVFKCNGVTWVKVGNLKGIAEITEETSDEDGGTNVITVTLTDGSEKIFYVKNGRTGNGIASITSIPSTEDDGLNTVTITMDDGTSRSFTVKNGSKGSKGDTGNAAGFGDPTASIDNNTGTPTVTVTASGSNEKKVFNFDFKNLKGNKGDPGAKGRSVDSLTMSGTGKQHPITATFSDGTTQVVGVVEDGKDGSGTGDMIKATYDSNDNGIVDKAEALSDGSTTIPIAVVMNKADKGTTLAEYGIEDAYTKQAVDELLEKKISEPTEEGQDGYALVTNGQGVREWREVASNWEKLNGKPFDELSEDIVAEEVELEEGVTIKKLVLGENVTDRLGEVDEVKKQVYGSNIFDTKNSSTSYYLKADGSLASSADWNVTDFIKVEGGKTYTLSGGTDLGTSPSVCWYDASKNRISGEAYSNRSSVTIPIPTNAEYIRATYAKTSVGTFMINEGSTALPYEPHAKSNAQLTEELSNIIKSFDYKGTSASNGTLSISNIPSDFGCFISSTHNMSGYFVSAPLYQYGDFKGLVFKDSGNLVPAVQEITGKIYYSAKK